MKRFLSFLTAVGLLLAVECPAFAKETDKVIIEKQDASEGTAFEFVRDYYQMSPSLLVATIDYTTDDEEQFQGVIIPYEEKDSLDEETRVIYEEAYNKLEKATDVTTLNQDLPKIVDRLYLSGDEVAISDAFIIQCTSNDDKGKSLTLKTATMEEFVALLRYEDGEWVVVEDVEWSEDGKTLTFEADGVYPYAVVVEVSTGSDGELPFAPYPVPITTCESPIEAVLKVTAYRDRETLSRRAERELDRCYRLIGAERDAAQFNDRLTFSENERENTKLNDELHALVTAKNAGRAEDEIFEETDIGVSVLFYVEADVVDGSNFITTMKIDGYDRFIALMRFRNDAWEIVKDVVMSDEDETITFEDNDSATYVVILEGASIVEDGDEEYFIEERPKR